MLAIHQIPAPICDICLEEYNNTDRQPMIYDPCHHGSCSICVAGLKVRTRTCQQCSIVWKADPTVNYQFMQSLQSASEIMVASASAHARLNVENDEKRGDRRILRRAERQGRRNGSCCDCF